jgi:hypothetical protein
MSIKIQRKESGDRNAVSGLPNPIFGTSPHSTESAHLESGLTISTLELFFPEPQPASAA